MSETLDAQGVTAVEPAPEIETTAAPIDADQPQPDTPETPPAKTFTQEELDAKMARRVATERRKWEREQAQQPQAPPADPYADPDLEAQIEQRVQERLRQQEETRARSEALNTYLDREEQARDKYDDFETVVHNPRLPITDAMAQVIQASEIGPDIAYHLGQNMAEARRIAQLPPIQQAREIGRLEAKLADAPPPPRKTSSAPAPISPVAPNGASRSFDTNDPRSIAAMSTEEWIAADRERLRKKLRGS